MRGVMRPVMTPMIVMVIVLATMAGGLVTRPGATAPAAATVPCRQCFPETELPLELRERAAELLLKALDGEALYTFVGDLKPMSSGFFSLSFPAANPPAETLALLDETRQLISAWRCGEAYYAGLHHFARQFEGKRYVDGLVIRRSRLEDLLVARSGFFAGYGITRRADPLEVVAAVEYASAAERLRHYGYLFGYPDHAVDFFVDAARSQEETGQFVKREFRRIPTFRAVDDRSPFVYAVPVGHVRNEADRRIEDQAAAILAAYRERRARYIGPGRPGVFRLMRDWFDDGRGQCSPANARWNRPR